MVGMMMVQVDVLRVHYGAKKGQQIGISKGPSRKFSFCLTLFRKLSGLGGLKLVRHGQSQVHPRRPENQYVIAINGFSQFDVADG